MIRNRERRPSRRVRPLRMFAAGLLGAGLSLPGCYSPPIETIPDAAGDEAGGGCAALLDSGLRMVRPEALELTTDAAQASDNLTQWLRRPECRDAVPASPISPSDEQVIVRLAGKAALEAAREPRLTEADVRHVRDSLLDFDAAAAATRGATDELDQARRAFAYVARSVTRYPSEGAPPLSPYRVRLYGRGTAEDRAWVFANLLRQLKLDAVVLRPAPGGEGSGDPWWVGVPLDGGVYLFDPELGLPVPAPGAEVDGPPTLAPRPATWAQAVAEPDLLVGYRREAGLPAEPVAPERLKSPRVELIWPAPARKQAMERLEQSLTEEGGVLLADPLHDTAAGPGLYRRVVQAGEGVWAEDAISLWPHPDRKDAVREGLSDAERQQFQILQLPYMAPLKLKVDEQARTASQEPTRQLWETRLAHLAGQSGRTIGSYLQIRGTEPVSEGPTPPQEVAQMLQAIDAVNARAADEAFYYVAHSQFEQGDYDAAAQTAFEYANRGGNRAAEAVGLFVQAVAATGRTADAARFAGQLPPAIPDAPRLRWLARRWGGGTPAASGPPPLLMRPEEPAEPTPAETPAEREPVEAPRP